MTERRFQKLMESLRDDISRQLGQRSGALTGVVLGIAHRDVSARIALLAEALARVAQSAKELNEP